MVSALPQFAPALAAIPAPSVHNVSIGPLTLHIYGLILGIGVLLGIWLLEYLVGRMGGEANNVLRVAIVAIGSGFVGARLYHVLSEPVRYAHAPGDIIKIWNGGLGIYGGVAVGAIVGLWYAPKRGIPRGMFADAAAPALALGQAIGRWGNYVNQELFGRPTDLPWRLHVDEPFRPVAYAARCCFHPTFLYESIYCAVLCLVLSQLVLHWRPRASGIIFPIYLAAYSGGRFLIEGLRVDHANAWLGLRQNQWVAVGIFVAAVATALWMHRNAPRVTRTKNVDTYG